MTEFNPEFVLQSLEEGHARGCLNDVLHAHWAQYVPSVYTAKLDADPGREERKAEKFLFRPMETFLCHGDPAEVFRSLKQKDEPPVMCGKVFKNGEPTYSCRDCSMDPTCVLCIECFEKSAHKKHRYKMSTSGGGGYCDCGDKEAWKSDPFCQLHVGNTETQTTTNPIEKLPVDIRERATQIFKSTVNYALMLLLWEECEKPPVSLMPSGELKNTFVTMLFNDEIHTYDQVINCLEKAIKCSHKEAVDHATTVDREGRSPIYYGRQEDCEVSKNIIERQTTRGGNKPLKVLVMHSTVVSHQHFAQKILAWLQQLIAKSDGLRQLFCALSLQNWFGEEQSVVEKMMLADTKQWKACRVQSHQLFMSGILMHPESKKQFAVIFTKMYPCLMKAFIQDDHEHSVCAISEAVQIFTVPTLARMLITEHDLIHVILSVFYEECKSKINAKGKLAFERQTNSQNFRRAQYMLYDLKYALTCTPTPEEWVPKLRTNFLHGMEDLLNLLKAIQGMDAVIRQVSQHIEFEPEWEGAFNLQLKLQDIICMVLDWAGSNEEVLRKMFSMTLVAARDIWTYENGTVRINMFRQSARCIDFTVSSESVSIHLPVTRLLAGLFPKLNLLDIAIKQICLQSELSPVALMEPALRSQVLVAQTSAGMWRRNGYSLLNQIYFYHNVRCRSEMYDRDILMLQVGAALIDPDEYLVHLLHKFGLQKWVEPPQPQTDDDREKDKDVDSQRQIVSLADEFLLVLIIILSERYQVGVGEVRPKDNIRREIIHQLCIQPMANSELVKALPDDHECSIDDVVLDVATFNMPKNVSGKGMYEVQEEFYKDYSPYFYHYSKSEQAKSEEAQRKRLVKQEEDVPGSTQGQALPPPFPPPFARGFSPIVKLLYSDTFILMLHMILERSQAKYVRWYTDSHLDKVFHLIGLALHEEKRAHEHNDHSYKFMKKALTEINGVSLLGQLERLICHSNITHAAQIDLLNWVLKYFGVVRQLRDGTYVMDMSNFPSMTAEQQEAQRKKEMKELADKRRAKLMNSMSKMQKSFIKRHKQMWDQTNSELELSEKSESEDLTMAEVLEASDHPIGVGPRRSDSYVGAPIRHICILCQEKDDITHQGRAMVLAGYIQTSTVLSKRLGEERGDSETYDPLLMPSTRVIGAYTSSCGHTMHSDCWQKFYDNVLLKERRRTMRFRHHLSYDVEKREFLCPLCECLANTVIPIIPSLPTLLQQRLKTEVQLSLNDWLDGIRKTVTNSIQEDKDSGDEFFMFVPCPLSSITKMMADSVAKNFQLLFDYVYDDASNHFSDSITNMLRKFSGDCYSTGLGVHPDEGNNRVPIMSWSTCAFTILATEECLREQKKPLFGSMTSRKEDCLSALVRFSAVCSQVIQQDMVRKHCIRLLSALLISNTTDRRVQSPVNIRDIDMFHYLVCLCLSLPTLYAEDDPTSAHLTRIPTGGLNDHHVLLLAYTAHIVQVILAADIKPEEPMETDADAEESKLLQIYLKLREMNGQDTSRPPSAHQVKMQVHCALLPFLRCSTLFFNLLTEVRPPSGLFEEKYDQFDLLSGYLDLPVDIHTLFERSDLLSQLVQSWCENKDPSIHAISYPPEPNQLVNLPDDYSELINRVSTFTCPSSDGDDSRAPTLCLVCGTTLCSQSYCCQTDLDNKTVGAATAHAATCGASSSVFLRVRECQVLLLSGRTKGCFFPPPYLDAYGETDQGLRRGNPLRLCAERYKKLQLLWQSHGIPEEIAHVLESNANLLSIEWHNL